MIRRGAGPAILLSTIALTACAATTPSVPTATTATARAQLPGMPDATATASAAAGTSSEATGTAGSGYCEGATLPVYVSSGYAGEQLGGMTLAVPHDRGSLDHAAGDAVLDADGVPVSYVVAADDVWDTVAARFCLTEVYLGWLNLIRRDGEELYPGDTINLDPHTIASVGDQNGVVYDNTVPDSFALPTQREAG